MPNNCMAAERETHNDPQPIYKKRLLKLAAHLRKGKLGHKKFDFDKFNADIRGEEISVNICGFSGCAIGECPIAFPNHWKFSRIGVPVIKGCNPGSRFAIRNAVLSSANRFFGLDDDAFRALFCPLALWEKRHKDFDYLKPLFKVAKVTKEQVAANIEAFVERNFPKTFRRKKAHGHNYWVSGDTKE